MLCSVGYHLFACHRSEKTSRRWLALDYAGISVGILGCYVPGIFYAFYCNAVSTDQDNGTQDLHYLSYFLAILHKSRDRCYSSIKIISNPFLLVVLATGLPTDGVVLDPGCLLCPSPPSLPQQRLAKVTDDNLLLCGWHQCDSCVPLGLAEWWIVNWCRKG